MIQSDELHMTWMKSFESLIFARLAESMESAAPEDDASEPAASEGEPVPEACTPPEADASPETEHAAPENGVSSPYARPNGLRRGVEVRDSEKRELTVVRCVTSCAHPRLACVHRHEVTSAARPSFSLACTCPSSP